MGLNSSRVRRYKKFLSLSIYTLYKSNRRLSYKIANLLWYNKELEVLIIISRFLEVKSK
jgi:hypothetical protein